MILATTLVLSHLYTLLYDDVPTKVKKFSIESIGHMAFHFFMLFIIYGALSLREETHAIYMRECVDVNIFVRLANVLNPRTMSHCNSMQLRENTLYFITNYHIVILLCIAVLYRSWYYISYMSYMYSNILKITTNIFNRIPGESKMTTLLNWGVKLGSFYMTYICFIHDKRSLLFTGFQNALNSMNHNQNQQNYNRYE